MKLFVIALPTQKSSIELLSSACAQRNVAFEVLNPKSTNPLSVGINAGDALYRISTSVHYGCLELEYSLLSYDIATFYANNSIFLINEGIVDSMSLPKLGVPTPKTINYLPADKTLEECVEQLGGFPVIVKGLGGQCGVGVMRLDSFESLFSVADFLRQQGGIFVLKEYCEARSTARLVVLGDQIIGSIEYSAGKHDFRSNTGNGQSMIAKEYGGEVDAMAIKTARVLGLEFGGVDIMLTDSGPKVAEINFPCFFPDVQRTTGVDIAGKMVEHLLAKSRAITGD